jgi:hypothetical protein
MRIMPVEVRFNITDRCPGRTMTEFGPLTLPLPRDLHATFAARRRYPSVLQRISNQDADSSSSAASGPDAARCNDTRRSNEAENRERAAKFRAALGRQDSESAADRAQAQATPRRDSVQADQAQDRAGARERDRAAAADILGRLGLGDDRPESGAADRPCSAQSAGTGKQADGAQAGSDGQTSPAGGADASKLHGNRGPDDAISPQAGQTDLGPEVQAIEDAIQKVIEQPQDSNDCAATPPADAFVVPGPTPWARPEGPARPEAPRQLPSPPPGTEAYHRLLMGQGPAGAEARLSITQGPLAGLQIHLTHGSGGVQAAVLTQGASSRQTLVSAMDQVAQRLRQKGHNLDLRFGSSGNQAAGGAPRRG